MRLTDKTVFCIIRSFVVSDACLEIGWRSSRRPTPRVRRRLIPIQSPNPILWSNHSVREEKIQVSRNRAVLLALALALVFGAVAQASMVQQMALGEVCAKADKIFRGTVLSVTEGKVAAGGGFLPTVTYRLKVVDAVQGEFQTKGDGQYAVITMFLSPKAPNGKPYIDMPVMQEGRDYLLMTTRPSAIGLSTTVGLGQGAFAISGKADAETAIDGLGNSYNYAELFSQVAAAAQ